MINLNKLSNQYDQHLCKLFVQHDQQDHAGRPSMIKYDQNQTQHIPYASTYYAVAK